MNVPGFTGVTRKQPPPCVLPFKTVAITASGDILPCCGFVARDMPVGNIETSTVSAAWNGVGMKGLRQLHKDNKGATNPICAHCLGAVDEP
jgi:radical SAM protein with 4Fe4S-binding SPASM domain